MLYILFHCEEKNSAYFLAFQQRDKEYNPSV